MSEHGRWVGDFTELRSHLDRAAGACHDAVDWVRHQLGVDHRLSDPFELPPSLAQLVEDVEKAQPLAYELWERFTWRPVAKYLGGELLSREEYYLLVAQNVLNCHAEGGDPYDEFLMLHYEDDERQCYINPQERPFPKGRIGIRVGAPPEDIFWDRLRPEQQDYFQRYPEVAVRFRHEA